MNREQFIQSSVISDMAEGVMAVRFDGVIELVNEAALEILEKTGEELAGNSFARAFFDGEENDAFNQVVLDAVYEKGRRQESYVPYRTARGIKQLRIVSSCLREQEKMIGVILVISDITELTEMRDAVRAMEKIQTLNRQLELRNRVLQETFGRYLSDDVVKEILDAPGGWKLGGQKRTLTVLMSDLRGFTALSERMAPQDLIAMLNHYFGEMYEEIERHHGTLIEFLGDGMMVIFGAPGVREHHAADAVAAALGMQRRMQSVNRWNEEQGYEPLHMGIGINTDAVILGNIGSEKRTKYGVLGAAVNLTGRIESYTTGGQVLISANTRAAIDAPLQIRKELRVSLKGVDGEIALSDVTGIGAPYEVCLPSQEEAPLRPLPEGTVVHFSVLEGKSVRDSVLEGRILALSEKGAILAAEAELLCYQNLELDIGGELYAKVIEAEPGRYRLCFTAKPPSFSAWFASLWGSRAEKEGTEE
ncbi:MAG: PAS domain-containing protein [Oscillospiraceae bacterium]|nr:PAS domain-containing protein [Oscillospiraceae bacterium]